MFHVASADLLCRSPLKWWTSWVSEYRRPEITECGIWGIGEDNACEVIKSLMTKSK